MSLEEIRANFKIFSKIRLKVLLYRISKEFYTIGTKGEIFFVDKVNSYLIPKNEERNEIIKKAIKWCKVKFELPRSEPWIAAIEWIVVNEFEPLLLTR